MTSAWDDYFTDIDPLSIEIDEALEEPTYYQQTMPFALHLLEPWAKGQEAESGEGRRFAHIYPLEIAIVDCTCSSNDL